MTTAVAVAAVTAAGAATGAGAAAGVAAAAGRAGAARVVAAEEAAASAAAAVAAVAVAAAAVAVAAVAAAGSVPTSAEGSAGNALPEASQVPPPAPWPSPRALARPAARRVRRVRPQGSRAGLADQPPDRGRSYRHDAQDQARRQGVDQRLPGQVLHEEAGRDPHGLRQGLPRGVGRRRQARPRDVRALGRGREPRPRGDAPGRPQAAREDQVRDERGRALMKASELRDLSDEKLRETIATARRDVFGLRLQHATGELENTAGMRGAKRDLARALTVARQRGLDPTVTTTAETVNG